MEAFFVVAIAVIMLGVGVLALLAVRRVAAYRNTDQQTTPGKDPQ